MEKQARGYQKQLPAAVAICLSGSLRGEEPQGEGKGTKGGGGKEGRRSLDGAEGLCKLKSFILVPLVLRRSCILMLCLHDPSLSLKRFNYLYIKVWCGHSTFKGICRGAGARINKACIV